MFSHPGLTHTPRSEKSEITFNSKDLSTILPYTTAMKEFLDKYDDVHQADQMTFEDCGGRLCAEAPLTPKTNGWQRARSVKRWGPNVFLCARYVTINPFLLQRSRQSTRTAGTWRATWALGGPADSPGPGWDLAQALRMQSLVSRKANPA